MAIEQLNEKKAHREKHACVLFLERCYKESLKCHKDAASYEDALPALLFQQYFDTFSSDEDAEALNFMGDGVSE